MSAPSDDRPKPDPGSVSPENPTRTREPSSTAQVPADTDGLPPPAPVLYGNPDRYVVIAEHGRGGLGLVSRAHDLGLGRDVAIKELLSRGAIAEVRFLREALITARLEHPGIIPVHEAGRWPDGRPYYAMKLVSGRPLRALIAERTTIDDRIGLLHHVIAVADAIAYAHDRNIIHRDLKPANVVVGDFGETIVIDWGLAKDLTSADDAAPTGSSGRGTPDNELTVAGSVLGTPSYMAPEQERGEAVDQRADVFAIGAMLWELCALEKLPPGDSRRQRVLRSAGIDDDLIAIIAKASDPDPARRYPHAGALAADLKAFKSGARIAARRYSLYALLAHWTRRHRAAALAALAFLAVGIASVTALAALYRSSRSNARTAHDRLIQSYEEQGRRLLLDGEYLHALPYLAEAYAQGDRSTAVRFLLARAERLASAQLAAHMHGTRARDAAFRPDGTHILSVSDSGEAAVWDAATGEVTAVLEAQPGGPYPTAVSRTGTFAAVARADAVTVWDGVRARTIATGPAQRIAVDAAGKRIAVIAGGELSVWSEATGERLWTASTEVAATQITWTGDAVVAVGVDTIARVANGRSVVPLPASAPVYAAYLGNTMIATAAEDSVELWDAAGVRLGKIATPARVNNVAIDRTAGRIAVAGADGIVRMYADPGGALLSELVGHRGGVRGMEFSADGSQLATTGSDLTVRVWDVARHRQIASLLGARTPYNTTGPRFDASGKRVVATTNSGEVRVFAATDPDAEVVARTPQPIAWVQFFDGGRRFSTSGLDAFRTWSSATGARLSELQLPSPSLVMPSPDGTKLVIVDAPTPDTARAGNAEIRDAVSQNVLARIHGPAPFATVVFDHAGQRIVTGSVHREVELWNLRGERLASFHGRNRRVVSGYFRFAFSADDRRLVVPSSEQSATIWDIASGRELGSLTVPGGANSTVFDVTSARFLTSGSGGAARLWSSDTFTLLRSFEFSGLVRLAAISPSGALIAGLTGGGVEILDVASGTLLTQFQDDELTDMAFSPDGDRLLTGDDSGAAVWHLGFETRPPEVVTAFVRCRVPYRLVETRLEPATPACE